MLSFFQALHPFHYFLLTCSVLIIIATRGVKRETAKLRKKTASLAQEIENLKHSSCHDNDE